MKLCRKLISCFVITNITTITTTTTLFLTNIKTTTTNAFTINSLSSSSSLESLNALSSIKKNRPLAVRKRRRETTAKSITNTCNLLATDEDSCCDNYISSNNNNNVDKIIITPLKNQKIEVNRRQALLTTVAAAASTTFLAPVVANALEEAEAPVKANKEMPSSSSAIIENNYPLESLEDLLLGKGQWNPYMSTVSNNNNSNSDNNNNNDLYTKYEKSVFTASFTTYAIRILISYDAGVNAWWNNKKQEYSLIMPISERNNKLGKALGSLAMSLQIALDKYMNNNDNSDTTGKKIIELANLFLMKYGSNNEAQRHIALLFTLLLPEYQPIDLLNKFATATSTTTTEDKLAASTSNTPLEILKEDLSALLPPEYSIVYDKGSKSYVISPSISLYEIGVDDEFGQAAVATTFGIVLANPLRRELPTYTKDIYTLFGISGATGCALTHTIVIPLDVVKTRMQTNPGSSIDRGATNNMIDSALNIVNNEGINGLLLGTQATIAGYFWYGLSVYPSYAFFKRFIGNTLLSPEQLTVHTNDVALVAGALASVIASLGLTPLEACRIRAVANPTKYRPLGLLGTIKDMSNEDTQLGWRLLYAGLPSLLTRQVIFGSVKFLAFERACEFIFALYPFLRDETWTSLSVSLLAGGFSGALSSVVSQPADSVLTYVAKNSDASSSSSDGNSKRKSLGVIDGSRIMIEKEGLSSLFRGLGSRCIWAGSIIAGQFLLYDVFRSYFHVTADDLSQVYEVVIQQSQSS